MICSKENTMAMLRLSGFVLVASTALSLTACVGGSGDEPIVGSAEQGAIAVMERACAGCHGDDMAGRLDPFSDNVTYYPDTVAYAANLTPDVATGIGSWDDVQIDVAIRVGVDDANKPMCEPMPVYPTMDDQEVADIIAYLRTVPAVNRAVPESTCPSQHGDPHDE
jgi:mono/diheme cytochrome c family protein